MTTGGRESLLYSFINANYLQVLFKLLYVLSAHRSLFIDEVMPATDSPAIIVARFLRANSFLEVCMGTMSRGVRLLDRRLTIARSGVTSRSNP